MRDRFGADAVLFDPAVGLVTERDVCAFRFRNQALRIENIFGSFRAIDDAATDSTVRLVIYNGEPSDILAMAADVSTSQLGAKYGVNVIFDSAGMPEGTPFNFPFGAVRPIETESGTATTILMMPPFSDIDLIFGKALMTLNVLGSTIAFNEQTSPIPGYRARP